MATPDALARFTPHSSCLWRSPCGPPRGACPSSILFLPAAAASGPSVWSDILLCGVSSVSSLSAQWVRCFHSRVVPLSLVLFRSTRPLRSFKRRQCLRAWSVAEKQGHGALRPRDNSTHNSSLAPLLTLRHYQGDKSSPFSHPFLVSPLGFANFAGRSCKIVKSRIDNENGLRTFSLSEAQEQRNNFFIYNHLFQTQSDTQAEQVFLRMSKSFDSLVSTHCLSLNRCIFRMCKLPQGFHYACL